MLGDGEQMGGKMKFKRSSCPITECYWILSGINGRCWLFAIWSSGKRRYQEFTSSPEKIASNILADRLKKLETGGLVTRYAYQRNPVRYEYLLTEKGEGLKPVLEAIIVWGKKHYPGTKRFPRIEQR